MSLEPTEIAMDFTTADHSRVRSALKPNHLDGALDGAASADGAEVCPLCLARYAAELECICIACEAPSCPDCAETLPGTRDVVCYACPVPTKH
jgi:hypothetical protein